jgi:hypothetical protein
MPAIIGGYKTGDPYILLYFVGIVGMIVPGDEQIRLICAPELLERYGTLAPIEDE